MKKLEKIDDFYSKINEDIGAFKDKDGVVTGGEIKIGRDNDILIDVDRKKHVDQITLVEYGMMTLISLLDSKSYPGWRKNLENGTIQAIKISFSGNSQTGFKEKDVLKLSKDVKAFMKQQGIVFRNIDGFESYIVFDTPSSLKAVNLRENSEEAFLEFIKSLEKHKDFVEVRKYSSSRYAVKFVKKGSPFVAAIIWDGPKFLK